MFEKDTYIQKVTFFSTKKKVWKKESIRKPQG